MRQGSTVHALIDSVLRDQRVPLALRLQVLERGAIREARRRSSVDVGAPLTQERRIVWIEACEAVAIEYASGVQRGLAVLFDVADSLQLSSAGRAALSDAVGARFWRLMLRDVRTTRGMFRDAIVDADLRRALAASRSPKWS